VTPDLPKAAYVAMIVALTALSSLGYEAALAMPDAFGGLAVLAAIVLIAYPRRLGGIEQAGLLALIGYAVVAHTENGLNILATIAAGWLWRFRRTRSWRGSARDIAPVAGVLALGCAALFAGNLLMEHAFGRPIHMPPFISGRMLGEGSVQPYLRKVCPSRPLVSCDLADAPPGDREYFTWIYPFEPPPRANGAMTPADVIARYDRPLTHHATEAQAERRERYIAEQPTLVLGALEVDGPHQLLEAYGNGSLAFLNFETGRDFDSASALASMGPSVNRTLLAALVAGPECVRPGQAACGRFDLDDVAGLQRMALLAAFLILAAGAVRKAAAPQGDLAGFLMHTLALVFANAFICGPLSGPFARYQARVEWLIPLGAMFLIAQWVRDWRAGGGQGDPSEPAP
jgi:hypothetical protein